MYIYLYAGTLNKILKKQKSSSSKGMTIRIVYSTYIHPNTCMWYIFHHVVKKSSAYKHKSEILR